MTPLVHEAKSALILDTTYNGETLASVIVVTWNTRDLTLQCLESLEKSLQGFGAEIIVVDNDSTDQSADHISEQHPDITLIRSAENLGFSRGNNLGFDYAKGKYLVLLNSDTLVLPGAIQALISYLETHPDVGAAGGQHLDADGQFTPSGYRFPSLRHDLSIASGLNKLGGWLLKRNSPLARLWFVIDTRDVDWLSGSFFAIRRSIIDEVGPLPPEFFVYGEDVEWFWRIRDAGWRVAYIHGKPIVHLESKSSEQLFRGKTPIRILDGFYMFARRHRHPVGWRVGWLVRAVYWFLLSIRWGLKAKLKSDSLAKKQSEFLRLFARRHINQIFGRVQPTILWTADGKPPM